MLFGGRSTGMALPPSSMRSNAAVSTRRSMAGTSETYLFSYQSRSVIQRELVIVLQTRLVDRLRLRASRPSPQNLLEQERQDLRERFHRLQQGTEETIRDDVREEID